MGAVIRPDGENAAGGAEKSFAFSGHFADSNHAASPSVRVF